MTATTTTTTDINAKSGGWRAIEGESFKVTAAVENRSAWTEYVRHHPQATIFHERLWTDVVTEIFGHQDRSLMVWNENRVTGVLPLMEMHSVLAGRLLVSTPYAPYGGPLANDETVCQLLINAAQSLRDRCSAKVLTLRSRTAVAPDIPVDDRYVSFNKALPVDLKGLGTFLPRKARAAARQARKRENLTVRHDNRALPRVYELYTRSMRRLGSLNYPLQFFTALERQLAFNFWVTVVERDEELIAGVISFVHGDTVSPYVLGVDERIRCTGATNLLYYAVMERAVKAQLAFFDFGRTRCDNTGPYEFKKNQGFTPQPLGYQHLPAPGAAAPDLSPSNPRFAFARRVWPRLPLTLTRPLGAWLSRAIPG